MDDFIRRMREGIDSLEKHGAYLEDKLPFWGVAGAAQDYPDAVDKPLTKSCKTLPKSTKTDKLWFLRILLFPISENKKNLENSMF